MRVFISVNGCYIRAFFDRKNKIDSQSPCAKIKIGFRLEVERSLKSGRVGSEVFWLTPPRIRDKRAIRN